MRPAWRILGRLPARRPSFHPAMSQEQAARDWFEQETMPLWARLERWRDTEPRPSARAWDDLVDDLYRAQCEVYGEFVSLGDFDLRHPGEASRLFLACGRWGWI